MEKEKRSFDAPSLTEDSLATLHDGQWLDDIIMDIQLRSIYNGLGPQRRRKSLIFPVYFYTKLKNGGCKDVIKWTKHEDIFKKDYLLIVENAHGVHWRLLIVCFPGKVEGEKIRKGRTWVQIKRPCILMLDSLFVQVHDSMEVFQNIRSYLTEMWASTGRKARIFSPDSMPALKVRVPGQQGNASECGIFVLLYAEHFLKDPPKELISELDCTSWFTVTEAFSKREEMRRILEASLNEKLEVNAAQGSGKEGKLAEGRREKGSVAEGSEGNLAKEHGEENLAERSRGGDTAKGSGEGNLAEGNEEEGDMAEGNEEERDMAEGNEEERDMAEGNEEERDMAEGNEEERDMAEGDEEEGDMAEESRETDIAEESGGDIDQGKGEGGHKAEGREERNIAERRDYKVMGRLAVPGTKRRYTVTQDELKRRITAENMSNNMLRSLIRVRKEDLPEELREQRPKKSKTKMSIFTALSEGEATDLALALGAMLGRHVNLDLTGSIPKAEAEAAKNTLHTIQQTLKESLGEDSDFSLLTHTFGPQAVEIVISFLISLLK